MKKHLILIFAILLCGTLSFQTVSAQLPLEKSLKKAKKAKDSQNQKKEEVLTNEGQQVALQESPKAWEWGDEVEMKLDGKDGSDDSHWVKGQVDEVKDQKYKVRWENTGGDAEESWVLSSQLRKAAPKEVYRLREELIELKEKMISKSIDSYSFNVYFDRAKERIQRISEDYPDFDISKSRRDWSAVRKEFDEIQKNERAQIAKENEIKEKEAEKEKAIIEERKKTGISDNGYGLLAEIETVRKEVEAGTINKSNWNEYENERKSSWIKEAFSKKRRDAVYNNYGSSYYNEKDKQAAEAAYGALAEVAAKQGMVFEEPLPAVLQFVLDEIVKVTEQVASYHPQKDAFIVNPHDGQWLKRAVSMKEREKWLSEFFKYGDPDGVKETFLKKLDKLSEVGKKIIPTFKPNPKNFSVHNAAEEILMKNELGDLSKIRIYQIGLAQSNWDIQKNGLGIPEKRFKVGYAWGQDSTDDHSYCKLYQVNIIQDYSGAGTYGASYAVYLENWLTGCP